MWLWVSIFSTVLKLHREGDAGLHLRNEFNFWYVHGIMNTPGLLQSSHEARDPKYS